MVETWGRNKYVSMWQEKFEIFNNFFESKEAVVRVSF